MSRIGKLPVAVPKGVEASLDGTTVKAKGPKGELSFDVPQGVIISLDDGVFTLKPANDSKESRSLWGMARTQVANTLEGAEKGFRKKLELVGVGYRVQLQGQALKLSLGLSHEVVYAPPPDVSFQCPKPTEIEISGLSKQVVGQVAAEIRALRPPEPFKGKGIKYEGEYILRKEGKKK